MSPRPPAFRNAPTRRIVMVGFPKAQILDITGPLEVFARTSRWLRDHGKASSDAYEIELVAARSGWFETSSGLRLYAARGYTEAADAHTVLIAGGVGYRDSMADRNLLDWVRKQRT